MRLRPPTADRYQRWEADWRSRPGYLPEKSRSRYKYWMVRALDHDGTQIGVVAAGCGSSHLRATAVICDIYIEPGFRRMGYARRALALVTAWARDHGATQLQAYTVPGGPGVALFRDFTVISRHKALKVDADMAPEPDPEITTMDDSEYGHWYSLLVPDYARGLALRDQTDPEETLNFAEKYLGQVLRNGLASPNNEFWTLSSDSAPVAYLWQAIDMSRSEIYVQDVLVEAEQRGRGYGRRIMRRAVTSAIAHGLDQVRLHVFDHNRTANALYDALGYRTCGEFRRRIID